MDVYLGGILLPRFANDGFQETPIANAPENTTLDGSLWVDVINHKHSWTITWDLISFADYRTIKNIYNAQFSNQTFTTLSIPTINVTVPVFLTITQPINLKYNGQYISNFVVQMDEQYAIS